MTQEHPLVVLAGHCVELAHQCAEQNPTPRWLNRRALRCAHMANLLATRLPDVAKRMKLEVSALDGYPSTASGADRGGGGRGQATVAVKVEGEGADFTDHVAVTGVEATFFQRLGKDDSQSMGVRSSAFDLETYTVDAARFARAASTAGADDVDDFLRLCDAALSQAHRICRRYTPEQPTPTCAGPGSGVECEQIPTPYRRADGLTWNDRCLDCAIVVERRDKANAERKRYQGKKSA